MGIIASVIDQNYPPKSGWSTANIPDLSSKVVIITGGSSGLGYETAKVLSVISFTRIHLNILRQALLSRNAKVYLACRDATKTQRVIEQLERETSEKAIFLELDLASLTSVKSAADEFLRYDIFGPFLHLLVPDSVQVRIRFACLVQQCVGISTWLTSQYRPTSPLT